LISGIGLLLLTMTNRLGRTIDRARQLCRELPASSGENRAQTLTQITIIYRRAQVIRLSIGLAGFSVLLVSALIIILFLGALLDWQAGVFIVLIFIVSMVSLFASLVAFLYDINLALHALRLELKSVKPDLC
jgi:glucan phosphoethanolaminetransferase (alkaline phosphatase superfamily)